METALSVILGIGLSAACGFRVFVPMLGTSIAALSGHLELSEGFGWIGTPAAAIGFGTATVIEIGAYYVPWLDNLLEKLNEDKPPFEHPALLELRRRVRQFRQRLADSKRDDLSSEFASVKAEIREALSGSAGTVTPSHHQRIAAAVRWLAAHEQAPGFVRALKYPSGKPCAATSTLVEPKEVACKRAGQHARNV